MGDNPLRVSAREVVRHATSPAVLTDANNRILDLNDPARQLLELGSRAAVEGRNLFKLLRARDASGNRLAAEPLDFWEQLIRGEEVRRFELRASRISGQALRLSVAVILILEPEPSRYKIVYMLRSLEEREKVASAAGGRGNGGAPEADHSLTKRQIEVLRALSLGRSVIEISQDLGVSVHTVRAHLRNIFERLSVHSQAEAVARAFQSHLL